MSRPALRASSLNRFIGAESGLMTATTRSATTTLPYPMFTRRTCTPYPIVGLTSLNILNLFPQALHLGLHRHHPRRHLRGLRLGADGVDFPVDLLRQEVQASTHSLGHSLGLGPRAATLSFPGPGAQPAELVEV